MFLLCHRETWHLFQWRDLCELWTTIHIGRQRVRLVRYITQTQQTTFLVLLSLELLWRPWMIRVQRIRLLNAFVEETKNSLVLEIISVQKIHEYSREFHFFKDHRVNLEAHIQHRASVEGCSHFKIMCPMHVTQHLRAVQQCIIESVHWWLGEYRISCSFKHSGISGALSILSF